MPLSRVSHSLDPYTHVKRYAEAIFINKIEKHPGFRDGSPKSVQREVDEQNSVSDDVALQRQD